MRLAGSHPTLRAALLTTACAAASSLAAAASPPLFPQLTFASTPPTTQARDYGTLLQLEYDNREAMTEALDRFEALDADVWFAGKRRNPHGHLAWHALVRQELPLDATLEGEAALAGASSGTAVPVQELFAQNPTLSTAYSQTLSAASVANLTSRVLHTARSEEDGGPIGLDDPIHDTYHPYEQIHTILNRFQDAFPGWVEVITLGKSSEGRDIWAVKVTKSSSNAAASPQDVAREDDDDEEEEEDGDDDDESVGPPPLFSSLVKKHKHRPGHGKFKFLIAGTQHSREWIAASTVLYLVHELVALDQQGKIPQRKLLEQVEFTFVPVVNVCPSLSRRERGGGSAVINVKTDLGFLRRAAPSVDSRMATSTPGSTTDSGASRANQSVAAASPLEPTPAPPPTTTTSLPPPPKTNTKNASAST